MLLHSVSKLISKAKFACRRQKSADGLTVYLRMAWHGLPSRKRAYAPPCPVLYFFIFMYLN